MLKDRPTLQKAIGAALAAIGIVVAIFIGGGDEEKDKQIAENVCDQFGDVELLGFRVGDSASCTHGPDPKRAFRTFGSVPSAADELLTSNRLLCKGDGVSGPRVHVFLGSPNGKEILTDEHRAGTLWSIQFAETQFRRSHADYYQGIRWLCSGGRVTIDEIDLPEIDNPNRYFFDVEDALSAQGLIEPLEHAAVVFVGPGAGTYPYCGQGSLFPDSRPKGTNEMADDPQVSITACIPGDTLVHELVHNFGGVHDEAPGASGAGHCFEATDVECYPDGGPYFASGGQIRNLCNNATFYGQLDCRKDSYWTPIPQTRRRGYLKTHWNISDSPFLTKARRR